MGHCALHVAREKVSTFVHGVALWALVAAAPAQATFHTFQIAEMYSDASGTVQFVELHEAFGFAFQDLFGGKTLTSTQGATVRIYTFSANLPSTATADRRVLIATPGFSSLSVVTPDFIVPAPFLFPNGGMLNFAGVDVLAYPALPTDGVNSLYRDGTTATNSPTNYAGQSGSVTLPPGPVSQPAAATGAASALAATGATLNGSASSNGANTTVTFHYGLTISYGNSVIAAQSPLGAGASGAAVSAAISGLACNTLYHFRAVAVNSAGTTNGGDVTFATTACNSGPQVTSNPATAITKTTATLNGAVTDAGRNVTAISFDYGTTTGYGSSATPNITAIVATVGVPTTVDPTAALAGLTCGTTYHFRIKATDATPVTSNGSDRTFTTSACADQTITFGGTPSVNVGGSGTVSATATSGLPVTFSSLTSGVCTVAGSTVTGVSAGVCTIAADQAGNTNYNPAPQAVQSFSVLQPVLRSLSVAQVGTGAGTVTSDPLGILCGGDCDEAYASGTMVTLIATPFAGSTFGGWGTACTGTGNCSVFLSADTHVIAIFEYIGSAYSYEYVQKAYVAYYGRPADPTGQAYWAGRMDAEGQSLNAIIGAFGYSEEFNRRYGGLSYAELVTRIYQQTLNRDPEQDGLDYYVGELQAGRRTLQSITLDVLNGATTVPDATVVANKLDVAAYYSLQVAAGCAYGTEQDGVNSLAGVTADLATMTAARAAIDSRCGP